MESKYITTPIYYANDVPHIGSTLTTLAADVLARFWRLKGDNTYFLTGTDEHGAKLAEAAEKAGITPQELVDKYSAEFEKAWESFNIHPDGFIRTTNPKHEQFVQDFLQKLYDSGHIYKGEYTGWYCTGCEEFKTGTQIGEDNTCPLHKTPLKEVSESAYLFKLSAFRDKLLEIIEKDELKVRPESRKNEVISFIREGLRDVAISRANVAWGIPVPWDEKHTVYVWIDALLNYLSATKEGVLDNSAPWPPTVQLIAKDILRFHAVIWPALLLAADEKLPKELFVHGYLSVDGQKMSKSLGNVIRPQELIDRYGVDGARYLLLAAVPFGADGDISFSRLDAIYNSHLANGFGNLVNRIQAMLVRYFDSVVPKSKFNEVDLRVFNYLAVQSVKHISDINLSEYLEELVVRHNRLNNLIEEKKPWDLAKDDKRDELDKLFARLAEELYLLGALLWPIIPESAEKILSIFGASVDQINYATLGEKSHIAGVTITPIAPLFPRIEG